MYLVYLEHLQKTVLLKMLLMNNIGPRCFVAEEATNIFSLRMQILPRDMGVLKET